MTQTEVIGFLAGVLIIGSTYPYANSIWKRETEPRLVSWVLWAFNGLVLLLTYSSSGAEDNIWPTVGAFVNPLLVVALVLVRQRKRLERPDGLEIACLVLSVSAMCLYVYVQADRGLSQWALYVSILADICAAVPAVRGMWVEPQSERPFAWLVFLSGEILSFGSITEHTVANYSLRVYMTTLGILICVPLVRYRLRHKVPLRQWV